MPNRTTQENLLSFVDNLIREGSSLGSSSYNVIGTDFSRFHSGLCTLFHFLGEHSAPWIHKFDRDSAPTDNDEAKRIIQNYVGVVFAIQRALHAGMLGRVEELVFAEAFDDLLEQAEYLQSENYFVAAGVLARAVLEEHLRKWCRSANCVPQKARPTINDYNSALYDAKHVTKIEMKQIDALAAIGNDAAHNVPSLTQADVERLIRELRQFLAQHPIAGA